MTEWPTIHKIILALFVVLLLVLLGGAWEGAKDDHAVSEQRVVNCLDRAPTQHEIDTGQPDC